MPREIPGGGFADVADAERVDEARQGRVLAFLDRSHNVGGGLLRHALEPAERIGIEPIQIRRGLARARARPAGRPASRRVLRYPCARRDAKCSSACLRWAGQNRPAGAARHRLTFEALHARAAHRAAFRHHEFPCIRRPPLHHDRDHLRDHVAGPPHDNRVADQDVLATHLVLVVQRRVGDRHPADEHRLQSRHRRQRAGAADLHLDVQDFRHGFLGRKFVRDREARRARDEAESLLVLQSVHLVHHAVDFVGQPIPPLSDIPIVAQQAIDPAHDAPLGRHPEALRRQIVEQLAVVVSAANMPSTPPMP